MTASASPTRMCVGCRVRKPAATMLRFRRRSDGHVIADARAFSAGRSAYLCPSRTCYQNAIKRRAFARALAGPKGLSVAAPSSTLWVDAKRAVTQQVEQLRRTSAAAGPSATPRRLNHLVELHTAMCRERGEHGAPIEEGMRHGQGSRL